MGDSSLQILAHCSTVRPEIEAVISFCVILRFPRLTFLAAYAKWRKSLAAEYAERRGRMLGRFSLEILAHRFHRAGNGCTDCQILRSAANLLCTVRKEKRDWRRQKRGRMHGRFKIVDIGSAFPQFEAVISSCVILRFPRLTFSPYAKRRKSWAAAKSFLVLCAKWRKSLAAEDAEKRGRILVAI